MKRSFILPAILLLSCVTAQANVVSQEKARTVAERFLHVDRTRAASGGLTLLWDGHDAGDKWTRAGEEPLLYVFTRPGGGWVIVSGEDAIEPVIAYSYHGHFEVKDMPDNLQAVFTNLKNDIRMARASGRKGNAAEWAQAMVETRASDTIPGAVLLHTASYNQGDPYNRKCPMVDGKRAIAGCCAIAQAIIYEYHHYPKAGTGTLKGVSRTGYTVPNITLGYEYDWDNILKSYKSGKFNDAQADAIATLVRDIAIMGESYFSPTSTGSYADMMCNRARTYFKYSKNAYRINHSIYSDADWFALLKKDIDAGLPMNYASSGHSYVCDGYDSRGYVHFNYGWGGTSDGYYNISGKTEYSCIVNFKPQPDDDGVSGNVYLTDHYIYHGIYNPDGVQISKGSQFNLKIGYIANLGFDAYHFDWVLAHVDKDNNIKEFISEPKKTTLEYKATTSAAKVQCSCNADVYLGDKVKAYYRTSGSDSEWIPRAFNRDAGLSNGELAMTGAPLEEVTSFKYDRLSKRMVVTTSKDADFRLLTAAGEKVGEGVSDSDGVITIDGTKLQSGDYTIELSHKAYIDVKKISFRIR